MTRGKSLAIAAAIHLLSLLALSQNWFTISMVVDSTPVQLGSYSGASAYPVASPLSLLCLAALAVVAISSGVAQRLAIALTTISPALALFLVLPPALESDVSALDSQLDRLTGIANTHGLQNLTVSQTPFIMVWALLVV
ncbi:MAG: hypothetical protein RIR24_357, partial [Actinomycetota bacterium]